MSDDIMSLEKKLNMKMIQHLLLRQKPVAKNRRRADGLTRPYEGPMWICIASRYYRPEVVNGSSDIIWHNFSLLCDDLVNCNWMRQGCVSTAVLMRGLTRHASESPASVEQSERERRMRAAHTGGEEFAEILHGEFEQLCTVISYYVTKILHHKVMRYFIQVHTALKDKETEVWVFHTTWDRESGNWKLYQHNTANHATMSDNETTKLRTCAWRDEPVYVP